MKYWVLFAGGVVLFLSLAINPGPVGFWVIAGIGGIAVYVGAGWRRIEQARVWRDFARTCGGEFAQSPLKVDQSIGATFGPDVLDFWRLSTSPSRAVTVTAPADPWTLVFDARFWDEVDGPSRRRVWYTRAVAPLHSASGLEFEIVPTGVSLPYRQRTDVQPLAEAQPALSRSWQVLSSDEPKMRDLLADPSVGRVLRQQGTVFLRTVSTPEGEALCLEEREIVVDAERLAGMRRLFLIILPVLARLAVGPSPATERPAEIAEPVNAPLPPRPDAPLSRPPLGGEPVTAPARSSGAASTKAAREAVADLPVGEGPAVVPVTGGEAAALGEPAPVSGEVTSLADDLGGLTGPEPGPAEGAGSPSVRGPGAGETASNDRWEVTLLAYGPYEQLVGHPPKSHPQGVLVAVDFQATNRQRWTANLTPAEVWIESADGRKISPAGETSSVEKGFWLDWVQGGHSLERRVVFDVDPAVTPVVLSLLGTRFDLPQ